MRANSLRLFKFQRNIKQLEDRIATYSIFEFIATYSIFISLNLIGKIKYPTSQAHLRSERDYNWEMAMRSANSQPNWLKNRRKERKSCFLDMFRRMSMSLVSRQSTDYLWTGNVI